MSNSFTINHLRTIMPTLPALKAEQFQSYLEQAMWDEGITSKTEIAAFLANLAHESKELTKWLENMNYRADRLLEVFPKYFNRTTANAYAHKPEAIANRVYANRYGNGDEASGDGWRFRAHGPIGLTFRANFRRFGDLLGVDLERNPHLAALPEYGFRIAALFWKLGGCNELAAKLSGKSTATRSDKKLLTTICERINGGHNGLAERIALYERACRVLHDVIEVRPEVLRAEVSNADRQVIAAAAAELKTPDVATAENGDDRGNEKPDLVTAAMRSDKAKSAGMKLLPRVVKHIGFAISAVGAFVEGHKFVSGFAAVVLLAVLAWVAYHNRKWIKAKLLEVLK